MAAKIQGADMEIRHKPRCEEIKPVCMRCAAVDAEDRRSADRAVVQVVQRRSVDIDKAALRRSWLKASRRSCNVLVYIVLAEIR
jgi:hypothetical protein